MDRSLYIDRATFLSFDRLKCLRNDYALNDCTLCIEMCASNAFYFDQGKLRLDILTCTNCGACVGICPMDALTLSSFDIECVVSDVEKEEEPLLTCKHKLPCLSAFGVDDWIVLLLRSHKDIQCSLAHCSACRVNNEGTVATAIEARIDEANRFVSQFTPWTLQKAYEDNSPILERREFLMKWLPKAHSLGEIVATAPNEGLKKAIKPYLQTLQDTKLKNFFSFGHQKHIDSHCANCKECVQFCPTQALSYNHDGASILFQSGLCIGCDICEAICKPQAMHKSKEPWDIVDFAYNKAKALMRHDLQVCRTCKCAFSYHGGEKICPRCISFEKEHSDMFILASEKE